MQDHHVLKNGSASPKVCQIPWDAQRVLSHQCVGGENLSAKFMKSTIPMANILTNTDKLATIYMIRKVIVYLKFTLIFS